MKKVISLILSLVMIITIVSSVNITAFAADGNVENAVQWAISYGGIVISCLLFPVCQHRRQ